MNIYQDNEQPGSGWNNDSGSRQNNSWNSGWSNEWQNGDPLHQDPYYGEPSYDASDRLASTSLSISIASMITTIFMTVIIPLILAPVSIVLAVISKGRARHLKGKAKTAVMISFLAIAVNCTMIISSFVMMFTNPQVRANVNSVMLPTYGITVEQEIEALDTAFGTDLESLLQGDSSQYNQDFLSEGGTHAEDL